MDVREMFVLVADTKVAVLCPGEHLDRLRSMVRIVRINRVRVLHGFVAVEVPVVAGCATTTTPTNKTVKATTGVDVSRSPLTGHASSAPMKGARAKMT
jgi:hypothetical protein